MKYIMYPSGSFVVWNENNIAHRDMNDAMMALGNSDPSSAGFVRENKDGSFECYGKSTTLGIESEERDNNTISVFFKRRQRDV